MHREAQRVKLELEFPQHSLALSVSTKPGELQFETRAGGHAQVDFAQFRVEFTDEPGVTRLILLFTMVFGYSRWLWGYFCATQDLQTVMRCHIDAFAALDGAPSELLYDRMKPPSSEKMPMGGSPKTIRSSRC